MAFVLEKLLIDVFDPEPGEVVVVVSDVPRPGAADTDRWVERRAMAAEWRDAFAALGERRGFDTLELLTYPATGANGAELPVEGELGGQAVRLDDTLLTATLACFLTQFSATAALDTFCKRKADFRAASMPGVERRMEKSALSADYREVARRAAILETILRGATALEVSFSTGHSCRFDLRFRTPEADDGFLPRGRKGDRIINLPSGEAFIVPYEGERPGIQSTTAGTIPLRVGPELVLFQVSANRITKVEGTGSEARRLRAFLRGRPGPRQRRGGRVRLQRVGAGHRQRAGGRRPASTGRTGAPSTSEVPSGRPRSCPPRRSSIRTSSMPGQPDPDRGGGGRPSRGP